MVDEIRGSFDGEGLEVAVVLAEFNDLITGQLKRGAVDTLTKCGVDDNSITVYKVPGSFEIPGMARRAVESGDYDGVICLGAVIRGETPHFEYVAGEVTRGVGKLSLESDVPVVYGIITAASVDQAVDRAGVKAGNKGAEAARTMVRQADLYDSV